MKRDGVTKSPAGRWTRPDDYLDAMARKRAARRARRPKDRTEPESPRLLLSTLPFIILFALLGVLAFAIMIAAYPVTQPKHYDPLPVRHETGVAPKGWYQEAERQFHR